MSSKLKLFGTDGIRGTANKFPVTPEIVLKVGQAMGFSCGNMPHRKGDKRMVLIGKDTRLSGYMVEQALASGLNSMGVGVQLTGRFQLRGSDLSHATCGGCGYYYFRFTQSLRG